ncbi:MAG: hypothetical protein DRH57_09150 [Candidatus Cloacimonadota bacterium]|nr:MAG: hypothetical protein DRH57_09150 [Candidatus Cloacimonadota bacterium]
MDFTELPPLDRVLEQCAWVCTDNNQGERSLCFNTVSGVFVFNNIEVGKPFHHKNVVVHGTAEEIYEQFLNMLEVPKEKALLNNEDSGVFQRHHLIQGIFNEYKGIIMENIESAHPEYLI